MSLLTHMRAYHRGEPEPRGSYTTRAQCPRCTLCYVLLAIDGNTILARSQDGRDHINPDNHSPKAQRCVSALASGESLVQGPVS